MGEEGPGKDPRIDQNKITMPRPTIIFGLILLSLSSLRCGYTTASTLPPEMRTIHIEQFKNRVAFTSENKRELYVPLLEVKVRNAIVDRFQFDGNMRIADADAASMTLKGELIAYDRVVLRYTDSNDPEEYRIQIVMDLKMMDNKINEPFWEEGGFTGEATYFVSGVNAKSESTAIEEATVDLARRVVERTIENW